MRNATDAGLLVTPAFQQSAAAAIAQADHRVPHRSRRLTDGTADHQGQAAPSGARAIVE